MVVPVVFRKSSEAAIASFSFTDLVTKTGYLTFHVAKATDDAVFLTPVAIESAEVNVSTFDTTIGGSSLRAELDVDIEFNQPQTIKGKAFVAASYFANGGNGVGSASTFLKVRLFHFDGTTETEIGTQQTTDTVTRNTAGVSYLRDLVVFDVSQKHFKIGEKFRLNIELWGSVGTNCSVGLYHDPKNRDVTGATKFGEALPTDLKCVVPFKIEL